jgi:hypothetical protein
MTGRPTRTLCPRPAPRRAAAGALVIAVLLALATGAPAARATAPPTPIASAPTATVVAGASVLMAQADEGTSTDDTKAGSGQSAPGDPPAWRGPLAFIGWILVAAGAFGFLIWIVFGRALLHSSDDESTADGTDASPPDAAPQ